MKILLPVLYIMFFYTHTLYSQEGVIQYRHILNVDTTQFEKKYTGVPAFLYFSIDKSLYTYNRNKDTSMTEFSKENQLSGSSVINYEERDEYGDMFYKDFARHKLAIRRIILGEAFITEEVLPTIQWTIVNDERKIGGFDCRKAVAYFRGREYEAWFTRDIPVNDGPWKLHGLPGLIVEAYDKNREVQFLFRSLNISLPVNKDIIKPEKGTHILFEEFKHVEEKQLQKISKMIKASMDRDDEIEIDMKVFPIEKQYE